MISEALSSLGDGDGSSVCVHYIFIVIGTNSVFLREVLRVEVGVCFPDRAFS